MVDYELSGRNAVITGASAGIGLGIAMSLAAQGVNLLLVSRDEERLKLSVKEISSKFKVQVDYVPGDVGEISLIKKVDIKIKENFSKCDILVNNAGGPPMGGFLEHGEEAWQSAFEINLLSAVRFSKLLAPGMKENEWGRIINITSTLAKEPSPQMVLSATMRAGVSAFTKAISTELASTGVTVNTVCPGGVLTQRMNNLVEQSAQDQGKSFEEVLASNEKSIPIGRFASTTEFADVVLFLISERARYLTGLSLMADGGLTKGIF